METKGQRARVKWGLNRAARAPSLPCGGLLLTLDAVRRAGVGGLEKDTGPAPSFMKDKQLIQLPYLCGVSWHGG